MAGTTMSTTRFLTLTLVVLLGEPVSSSSHPNESASLHQILQNVRHIDFGSTTSAPEGEKKNHTLSLVLPCSYGDTIRKKPFIQDSTSSVLAAKAFAKTVLPAAGTVGEEADPLDSLAWDLLDAVLFPTKDTPEEEVAGLHFQSLGILPKYWYFAQDHQHSSPANYYLEETRFPHWSLFQLDDGYKKASQRIQSSQRLSALPLHASLLWDMLLVVIPPQPQQKHQHGLLHSSPYSYNYDQNKDWWDRVHHYFQTIYQHHEYLHEVVMRGCNPQSTLPCYNVLHPWESLVQPHSPVWETALESVMETLVQENWTIPFVIPSLVQESYDFPPNPEVYDAMMYLFLEGWNQVNLTKACPQSTSDDDDDAVDDKWCPEEALFNATQFAVLDVGYAAILSQADADLAQLGWVLRQVLPDSNIRNRLDQQMQSLEEWRSHNSHVLQELLWLPTHFSYQSRYYSSKSRKMEWLEEAVSNNLIPFWNTAAASKSEEEDTTGNNAQKPKPKVFNDEDDDSQMRQLAQEHMQDLSLQLLHRQGNYSFDCGPFPLWSHGGCEVDPPPKSTNIQPLVNHLIGNGLLRGDGFHAMGTYIAGQSLELLRHGGGFGESYRATSPFENLAKLDSCGRTCTLTAAVAYNFKVPDPARTNRLPLPPIRESWVITLITFELLVAFSIGVSCLVLSFNLVRKLRDYTPIPLDDEDAYDSYDSYYDGEAPADDGSPQHYDSTGTSEPQSNGTEPAQSSFFGSIGLN